MMDELKKVILRTLANRTLEDHAENFSQQQGQKELSQEGQQAKMDKREKSMCSV